MGARPKNQAGHTIGASPTVLESSPQGEHAAGRLAKFQVLRIQRLPLAGEACDPGHLQPQTRGVQTRRNLKPGQMAARPRDTVPRTRYHPRDNPSRGQWEKPVWKTEDRESPTVQRGSTGTPPTPAHRGPCARTRPMPTSKVRSRCDIPSLRRATPTGVDQRKVLLRAGTHRTAVPLRRSRRGRAGSTECRSTTPGR